MASTLSIIGAGNLGTAMAVHLCKQGHRVCLAGTPGHLGIIPDIQQNDDRLVEVDGRAGLEHEAEGVTVQVDTGDITQAVRSQTIMVTVPISAHENVINALSSHNLRGRTLIFMPCGIAAGLLRTSMSKDRMPNLILGTVSSPFASRTRKNGRIAITRIKNQLEIAASRHVSTSSRNNLACLFPQRLVWYPDLASIFFSNVNPVIHPATMLVSRELIANSDPRPLFYEKCMPAAEQRILAVDNERCMLAKALGLRTKTLYEYFLAWYTPEAKSYMDSVNSTPSYKGRRAPSFNHRYLTEDLKHVLILVHEIAAKTTVPVPNINWIINEANTALNENLLKTGTSLRSLNLENASADQIVEWLNGDDHTN